HDRGPPARAAKCSGGDTRCRESFLEKARPQVRRRLACRRLAMIQNPVLRKELMVKLRLRPGAHAQNGVIIAIVLLIGLFHFYFIDWLLKDNRGDNGRTTFMWFVCLQYALICLITPAIAANAITQEREQQTWDMLLFTRLTPTEIILGKLMG